MCWPWKNASPSGAVRRFSLDTMTSGEQELVPRPHEDEHHHREDRGPPERHEHAPQRRPARRAVDARGLHQRARRRAEERAHPERAERDRDARSAGGSAPSTCRSAGAGAGRSRAARSSPPRGPSGRAGRRRRAPSSRGSASARRRSRRGSRAPSRPPTTLTATIALERRYCEKWPCVHASEKFPKWMLDGMPKPGRVGRAERGHQHAEHRVQRDQREHDQDRVVQRLLAAGDHRCVGWPDDAMCTDVGMTRGRGALRECGSAPPRSAIRVMRKLSTKMTSASVKPTAHAEPICADLERAVVDDERRHRGRVAGAALGRDVDRGRSSAARRSSSASAPPRSRRAGSAASPRRTRGTARRRPRGRRRTGSAGSSARRP